jgi:secreted Zn-dependent insulinase-like peptidase
MSLSDRKKPIVRITALENKTEYIQRLHCRDYDPDQPNSAVENAYFLNDMSVFPDTLVNVDAIDVSDAIIADTMVTFLAHIMHEAAFNQLRTIEQLGYVVHVGQSSIEHKYFLRVIVQSTVLDGAKLNERIEVFLRQYYRDFLCDDDASGEDQSDLPMRDEEVVGKGPLLADPETFQTYIESLCEKLEEPSISHADEFNNLWAEISAYRYTFDRKAEMVSFLRQLTFADVKRFWNMFIRKSDNAKGRGQYRCKFSSQFFGKGTHFPVKDPKENVVYIENASEFKASRSSEPVVFHPK